MNRSSAIFLVCSVCVIATGRLNAQSAEKQPTKQQAIDHDRQLLAGSWRVVALTIDGKELAREYLTTLTVVNEPDGGWIVSNSDQQVLRGNSQIDPSTDPKTIDFEVTAGDQQGKLYHGIYELQKNRRKLAFTAVDQPRPTKFVCEPGVKCILVQFERVPADTSTP